MIIMTKIIMLTYCYTDMCRHAGPEGDPTEGRVTCGNQAGGFEFLANKKRELVCAQNI